MTASSKITQKIHVSGSYLCVACTYDLSRDRKKTLASARERYVHLVRMPNCVVYDGQ